MENLELNEQHQGIVRSYMKFAKYQRSQTLKSVAMSFEDVSDTRLLEPMFTRDEVDELLMSLKELIQGEIEAELISSAHTNILLLSQLFKQAEKWHLRMTVDLSEIQNRELLEHIKVMEESDVRTQPERPRLQPLIDNSGTMELLRIEIERLKEENSRFESTLQEQESKIKMLSEEKEKTNLLLKEKEEEVIELQQKTEDLMHTVNSYQDNISSKSNSEQILGEYEKVLSEQLCLELESMKQEVLDVKSQLTLAEEELTKKFNQTAAYSNLKVMIEKKNDQVKELRKQLQKYQEVDDDNE